MRLSKARDEVPEEENLSYFVWFSAHRVFLPLMRLNFRNDASRWLKMRFRKGRLPLRVWALRLSRWSPGVRQVGTRDPFVLYFTDQNAPRVSWMRNFVVQHGVAYFMPMCILYCILHIRMRLLSASVDAVSDYGGVF